MVVTTWCFGVGEFIKYFQPVEFLISTHALRKGFAMKIFQMEKCKESLMEYNED